jgi:hypothetical protein
MNDHASTLILRLGPDAFDVNALSSILQSLQAAIHATALETPDGPSLFRRHPTPTLTAQFLSAKQGFEIRFSFTSTTGAQMPGLSRATFDRLLSAIESELDDRPRRMMWGATAVAVAPENASGIRQVLEDLRRLGYACIESGARRIELKREEEVRAAVRW